MAETIINRYRQTAQYFVEDLGNGIELEMVLIKGGNFLIALVGANRTVAQLYKFKIMAV